jgi:hypothetical protein
MLIDFERVDITKVPVALTKTKEEREYEITMDTIMTTNYGCSGNRSKRRWGSVANFVVEPKELRCDGSRAKRSYQVLHPISDRYLEQPGETEAVPKGGQTTKSTGTVKVGGDPDGMSKKRKKDSGLPGVHFNG